MSDQDAPTTPAEAEPFDVSEEEEEAAQRMILIAAAGALTAASQLCLDAVKGIMDPEVALIRANELAALGIANLEFMISDEEDEEDPGD